MFQVSRQAGSINIADEVKGSLPEIPLLLGGGVHLLFYSVLQLIGQEPTDSMEGNRLYSIN